MKAVKDGVQLIISDKQFLQKSIDALKQAQSSILRTCLLRTRPSRFTFVLDELKAELELYDTQPVQIKVLFCEG